MNIVIFTFFLYGAPATFPQLVLHLLKSHTQCLSALTGAPLINVWPKFSDSLITGLSNRRKSEVFLLSSSCKVRSWAGSLHVGVGLPPVAYQAYNTSSAQRARSGCPRVIERKLEEEKRWRCVGGTMSSLPSHLITSAALPCSCNPAVWKHVLNGLKGPSGKYVNSASA